MSVFVDTSAFYALLVQTDADHEAVATEFRGLVEEIVALEDEADL